MCNHAATSDHLSSCMPPCLDLDRLSHTLTPFAWRFGWAPHCCLRSLPLPGPNPPKSQHGAWGTPPPEFSTTFSGHSALMLALSTLNTRPLSHSQITPLTSFVAHHLSAVLRRFCTQLFHIVRTSISAPDRSMSPTRQLCPTQSNVTGRPVLQAPSCGSGPDLGFPEIPSQRC